MFSFKGKEYLYFFTVDVCEIHIFSKFQFNLHLRVSVSKCHCFLTLVTVSLLAQLAVQLAGLTKVFRHRASWLACYSSGYLCNTIQRHQTVSSSHSVDDFGLFLNVLN